jgi:hypothetical protein
LKPQSTQPELVTILPPGARAFETVRKARNVTRQMVADAIERDITSLRFYLSGNIAVPLRRLEEMARAVGCGSWPEMEALAASLLELTDGPSSTADARAS